MTRRDRAIILLRVLAVFLQALTRMRRLRGGLVQTVLT